jgi:hypothetical protein
MSNFTTQSISFKNRETGYETLPPCYIFNYQPYGWVRLGLSMVCSFGIGR